MAGTLIVSNLKTDTDNSFIVRSNTGTTLFVANTTGIDVANSFASSSITSDKILSVANTKISGNIISSQIAPSVTLYGNPIVTGNLTLDTTATSKLYLSAANTVKVQTANTTALTISSAQIVDFANAPTVAGGAIVSAATPTALGTVYGKTDNAALTFLGYYAGANTTGTGCTAVGYVALQNNTTGGYNTVVGWNAGQACTGSENTFVGVQAGSTSTGSYNVAVGKQALQVNTSGTYNVGVGLQSLGSLTTGTGNIAIGYQALYNNTTPGNNIAIGYQAVGTGNGGNVTAVGYQAGIGSTCDNASYFGYQCGYNATGGNGAIAIGAKINFGSASPVNEVVLGVNAGATVTGKGNSSFFVIAGGGGYYNGGNSSSWNTTSDRRIKKNIVDNNDGLNKITGIRVRNFEYRLSEEITELPPEQAVLKSGVQLGVIAQELQEVLPECITEMSTGVLTVQHDNLTWYMINAIKELKAEFDAYKATHP